MDPCRIFAELPSLERPVVLLEGGAGQPSRARLAWGARRRFRIGWDDVVPAAGDVARLLPADLDHAYGVIAYDAGLPPGAIRRAPLVAQPLVDLFVPRHEIVFDPRAWAAVAVTEPPPPAPGDALAASFTESAFARAVGRIREYIAAGDVYQVNLSLAERFAVHVSPWDAYRRLRASNPSPWMGFADFGDWQLVSGSPELLLEAGPGTTGGMALRTRPIAGTRKKTGEAARDDAMRHELRLDEKERAEHRMLLDLARNDLGRVAEFGTVQVSEREVVEEYSHVFHLVSEVRATCAAVAPSWEMLAALFPGGTITGAPKRRAMEVIAELEPVGRGAYTGALGWIGPDGMQFNILIRSAVMRDGEALVQAGAGIVWDSDPEREWRESRRKGAAMREALGVAAAAPVGRDVPASLGSTD